MPRIACLMMLKDENLLAELWLRYHGYLFGFENLYVYDNGSRDELVLATLRRFAAAGVNVDFSRSSMEDFVGKGDIIGAKINEFKDADRYDIAIPLDCDEFVALAGDCGPSVSRTEIIAEFQRIHEAGAVCQTAKCFYNVPGYLDQFWLSKHEKCIVPVPAFATLDHGFHLANFHFESYVAGIAYGATRICYIHLHHKPFEHLMDGVNNKIGGSVDIKNPDAVKAYTGFGHHLTKFPGMTRETYYNHIDSGSVPFLRFSGFLRLSEVLMDFAATRQAWEAGRPAGRGNAAVLDLDATPFDAADYLAANPDLAGEANLFFHYVETGYGEGRAFGLAGRLREAALQAMQQGRNAEAVGLWAEFRARFPADPEGYDCAVIACRNAGIDADEIILAALGARQEYLGIAAAIAQSAEPPRAEVFREALGRLGVTNSA